MNVVIPREDHTMKVSVLLYSEYQAGSNKSICVRREYSNRSDSYINKDLKNIKNVKRCRDGMPKSMQTR